MFRKIITIMALVGLSFLYSCVSESGVVNLSPGEFQDAIDQGGLLLDVRSIEEFEDAHINGATLIPVQELEARISELDEYKNQEILVYCRSGNRSRAAADILIQNGFTNVYNLTSGISGWTSAGFPVE